MTPEGFIKKWQAAELKESAAAQSHFIDLCHMLGEPTPTDADHKGDWYCFEKGATKTTGGEGWADVWKKGCFGWEYKGKRKDLNAAFAQLQQYALALENPPLLVVCDLDRFRIHTNWTNSISQVHEFALADLKDPANRQKLKWVLSDPEKLRPAKTRQMLTEQVAAEFAKLAQRLRDRGYPSQQVAHFINRLVFCMFAEDVDLLSNKLFSKMLKSAASSPEQFAQRASDLFRAMKAGGEAAWEKVDWFNGGLFDDDTALPLDADDLALAIKAAELDWSEIDPSILGTLFERGLDPGKRAQLGAHYTDREKIMLIIEPVVVRPWLAEWEATKAEIVAVLDKAKAAKSPSARTKAHDQAVSMYRAFLDRLRKFTVLDPACGSGNFLYLALLSLKDIEHRVGIEAEALGLHREFPHIGPSSVKGIEINAYAAELARVSVWIGEIQWMRRNGFDVSRNPILKPLDNIQCRDAVLNDNGTEAEWPDADVIVGNPPFLGAKLMKRRLGVDYTVRLRTAYSGRLAAFTDLVCYWFEKARADLLKGRYRRAGLVATSSIRGGTNRPVMDRISGDLKIFDAWSELPWTVDGARVEVSLVCFDRSASPELRLNGDVVGNINPDLTTGIDLTTAKPLAENSGTAFIGIQTTGPLDLTGSTARFFLQEPLNPNGHANSEVLKPYWNGDDVTGRPRDQWLIDFPLDLSDAQASRYASLYNYLAKQTYVVERGKSPVLFSAFRQNTAGQNPNWWEPHRPRPEMRGLIEGLPRYIVTPEVAQHRLFVWLRYPVLPDKNLIVIAKDDDVTFGILQSRFHTLWSLRLGTSLEDRPRYTSTTTFATYPFPRGLTPNLASSTYAQHVNAAAIADAARSLVALRNNWLWPSDLVHTVHEVRPGLPDRLVANDPAAAMQLRQRTLTNLYNERPVWLDLAHKDLDAAVAAAYGWPESISDDEALEKLLELNLKRSGAGKPEAVEVAAS